MIKLNNVSVMNFENAIRGMRNPMNSWDKSDSNWCYYIDNLNCDTCPLVDSCSKNYFDNDGGYIIGENDMKLAKSLVKAGSDERKFLRQVFISVDITAPLYWWKEMDTYKVGTVSNSCSTMHKITDKKFTLDDFSHEHLLDDHSESPMYVLETVVDYLNIFRDNFLFMQEELSKDMTRDRMLELQKEKKDYWWQIIQLLPSSYNQRRTWTANYEVLRNIYHARKNHKLDEWREFCTWIETLPYAKEFIMEQKQ